jgi:hypothetical protein
MVWGDYWHNVTYPFYGTLALLIALFQEIWGNFTFYIAF